MTRTPFHYGMYYRAMIGLIGRKPDTAVRHGMDGFYDFIYEPQDDQECQQFPEYVQVLHEWLNHFDILFSDSRVEWTDQWGSGKKKILRVIIQHEVET